MRKIDRVSLSASVMASLSALTTDVVGAADPKARAGALWDAKPKETFQEVRTVLKRMASGRERCMYCEDSEGTDIEHFWPKSSYPERAFSWSNYLLACSHCNSNYKRAQFPLVDGGPALLDPTSESDDDHPSRHLRLIPTSGRYTPIGPKGEPSIRVFDLNGDERGRKLPQGRRDVFVKLQSLLLDYDALTKIGDHSLAHATKRALLNEPFSSVFGFLIELSRQPGAERVLRPGIVQVIQRHGIAGW